MKNALIDNVPAEFYDTQVYNDFSFVIINAINNAFTECDDLLKQNGHNKYHNLVAIFYHHLTRLLTSYVFCKYEIDDAKIRLDNRLIDLQSTTDHKYIWPINYSSVNNSNFELIGHEYKNIWPSTGLFRWFIKSNYKKIITIFNKLSPDFGIGRILLSANSGINPKSLTDTGYNIRMMDTNTKVFIANFSEQVDILLKLIKSSEPDIQELFPKKFEFDNQFIQFIEKELKVYCVKKKIRAMKEKVLVVGSLTDLKTRINASIAKSKDIPVISIWHGEFIGDKDEPVFGPVEQTFCDVILGFGDYGCQAILRGDYNQALFEKPVIIPGSSDKVKTVYDDSRIEKISNINQKILMYVPTSFSGTNRYGPFRDIHDFSYLSWQKNMLSNISNYMKPKRLIRKGHRKELMNLKFEVNGVNTINKPDFIDVIQEPDIFIFDYPSTAFALAAATSKAIIYFDIGLRNLKPGALDSIKERCVYINGAAIDAQSLVLRAYQERDKQCKNTYTPRYSLSKNPREREHILIELIKEYAIA